MVSISGTCCRSGLLLILVVCSFTCVAVGRGVAGGNDVIEKLQESGGENGGVGVGDSGSRILVDGADDDKSTQRSDRAEAKRVGGVDLVARRLLNVKLEAETTETGSNGTEVGSGSNSTAGGGSPRATDTPPAGRAKDNSTETVVPGGNGTVAHPPPQDASASAGEEGMSAPAHGGTCTEHGGPVIASVAANGGDDEDGDHDYTLAVENGGGKAELEVGIKTSLGLKADREGLKLKKGEPQRVTISVIDKKEAARSGSRINISWGEGDCYVDVPVESVGEKGVHESYLSMLGGQGPFVLVLGGTLVFILILGVVGVWGCMSWRAHARRHGDAEAKYQELEMTLPGALSKQDDGISPSADGWDESWEEDDWQDMEAVRSSSASITLSANGLNSRRANKDGWENTWDD